MACGSTGQENEVGSMRPESVRQGASVQGHVFEDETVHEVRRPMDVRFRLLQEVPPQDPRVHPTTRSRVVEEEVDDGSGVGSRSTCDWATPLAYLTSSSGTVYIPSSCTPSGSPPLYYGYSRSCKPTKSGAYSSGRASFRRWTT